MSYAHSPLAYAFGGLLGSTVTHDPATYVLRGILDAGGTPPVPPVPPSTDSLLDLGSVSTLWRVIPNWRDTPAHAVDYGREVIDLSASKVQLANFGDALAHAITYRYTCVTQAEIAELLAFFDGRQGRLKRFWVPVWRNDFTLAATAVALSDTVDVAAFGGEDAFQGEERVFWTLTDGSVLTRHVTQVVDNGDGTETFTLASPLDREFSPGDVRFFGRLLLVRLDADEVEFSYPTADVCEVALPMMELPMEYSEVGGES